MLTIALNQLLLVSVLTKSSVYIGG